MKSDNHNISPCLQYHSTLQYIELKTFYWQESGDAVTATADWLSGTNAALCISNTKIPIIRRKQVVLWLNTF